MTIGREILTCKPTTYQLLCTLALCGSFSDDNFVLVKKLLILALNYVFNARHRNSRLLCSQGLLSQQTTKYLFKVHHIHCHSVEKFGKHIYVFPGIVPSLPITF